MPKSLVRRRKSRWRLSGRRCRSSLSRRFLTFQPSKNDQAIFLSLMILLAWLSDVSKVVNRNRRLVATCTVNVLINNKVARVKRPCYLGTALCLCSGRFSAEARGTKMFSKPVLYPGLLLFVHQSLSWTVKAIYYHHTLTRATILRFFPTLRSVSCTRGPSVLFKTGPWPL